MPTIKATLFASIAAVAALGASVAAARYAVEQLETRLVAQARAALGPQDDWLKISASGQQLTLSGAAPADDARTAALARVTAAGLSAVLLDRTAIAPQDENAPARQPVAELGVEIVFGPGATAIFGQIPGAADAADPFIELAETLKAAPMLSPQRGHVPEAWDDSVALAVKAVGLLDRGRVAVSPGRVEIRASAASDSAREQALAALQPGEGVVLDAEISAPRRVITPFAFEATLSEQYGWQIARCSAATVAGRDRILARLDSGAECEVGLGAPSPDWPDAVVAGLETLEALGAGQLEIADTDIVVTGVSGLAEEDFAARTAALAEELPAMFSLSAKLPQPEQPAAEDGASPEAGFRVTRSAEGLVSLTGKLPDARVQVTTQNVAEAQFGLGAVTNETELGENLPAGWTAQVLAGLEVLGMLDHGTLEIAPGELRLSGTVNTMRMRDDIQRILAERLPSETRVVLDMEEAERAAPPVAARTIPYQLCAEQIALELSRNRIDFPPSESEIDEASLPVVDRLAEIMAQCPGARFEVAGHTDSQGRESSNMALSQARADAVLTALLERNVDTVFLYAKGYGETEPVASNDTEEGRAANRRIEFSLVDDDAPVTDEEAVDAQEAAPDAPEAPGPPAGSAAAAVGEGDAAPETPDAAQQVATPDAESDTPPEADETAPRPEDGATSSEEDAGVTAEDAVAPVEAEAGSPVVSRAAQASIEALVTTEDDDGAADEPAQSGPKRPRLRPEDLDE